MCRGDRNTINVKNNLICIYCANISNTFDCIGLLAEHEERGEMEGEEERRSEKERTSGYNNMYTACEIILSITRAKYSIHVYICITHRWL